MKLFRKVFISIFTAVLFVSIVGKVSLAADKLIFDSTDHYIGACALTNKSQWELKEPIDVTTFEVWYSWNQGETELPVKVLKDGKAFAEFIAVRGNCDPYQRQWCNADFKINKNFPEGVYSTEIPEQRQCLKPGGTGAIRLYTVDDTAAATLEKTSETTVVKSEPEPVVVNQTKQEPAAAAAPVVQEVKTQPGACTCNQTTTAAVAAGTSFLISLVLGLLLKRK